VKNGNNTLVWFYGSSTPVSLSAGFHSGSVNLHITNGELGHCGKAGAKTGSHQISFKCHVMEP